MKNNTPSIIADTTTAENCQFFVVKDGKVSNIIRLRATGFWVITEDNACERLKKSGATILWEKPAESESYVGTWAGELHEIAYDLPDGSRRYCYTLLSQGDVDSYTQECWTTENRLTANAAADTIVAARKIAYAR